jgi:hypothetical protein
MAERFGRETRIRDVLAMGPLGRHLLWQHGYDSGEGFVDVLSQYQSLEEAERGGRIRGLDGLLAELDAEAVKGRVPEAVPEISTES